MDKDAVVEQRHLLESTTSTRIDDAVDELPISNQDQQPPVWLVRVELRMGFWWFLARIWLRDTVGLWLRNLLASALAYGMPTTTRTVTALKHPSSGNTGSGGSASVTDPAVAPKGTATSASTMVSPPLTRIAWNRQPSMNTGPDSVLVHAPAVIMTTTPAMTTTTTTTTTTTSTTSQPPTRVPRKRLLSRYPFATPSMLRRGLCPDRTRNPFFPHLRPPTALRPSQWHPASSPIASTASAVPMSPRSPATSRPASPVHPHVVAMMGQYFGSNAELLTVDRMGLERFLRDTSTSTATTAATLTTTTYNPITTAVWDMRNSGTRAYRSRHSEELHSLMVFPQQPSSTTSTDSGSTLNTAGTTPLRRRRTSI